MSAFKNITSADDLKAAVQDKSNAQITREVAEAGIDQVVQMVFMGMMMAFRADKARDARAVIEYRIRALDKKLRYQVKIADGQCTIHPDGSETPDVKIWTSVADFLRLTTNTLNIPVALLTLRLRLWGKRDVLKRLPRWFG